MEKDTLTQAILLADNFNKNFAPITTNSPLALLPLVNVPLIDYALECLSLGGVDETYLFCCTFAEQIKDHIDEQKKLAAGWSVTMKVNVLVSESCRSMGDVMRDIDAKGLIRGNFILLGVNSVANIKLLPILKKHIEVASKDKGAAITLIMQKCGVGSKKDASQNFVMVADAKNRVLFHQKLKRNSSQEIKFPLEIFWNNSKVSVHYDLKDTEISICSPSVLPLFADNFDFQTRDDFIKGLLMNEEILASTLYWHEIKGSQYGTSVNDWSTYQRTSRDVIHRWVYPLVPDLGVSRRQQVYMYLRNNIYKSKDVKMGNNCDLEEDVVIAQSCAIEKNSNITRSVIGEHCCIGNNVTISDSFIASNTKIGNKCAISFSLIGSGCKIGNGCRILNGTIIGPNVQLADNQKVEGVLVQATKPIDSKPEDKLGANAFLLRHLDGESDVEDENVADNYSRLYTGSESSESDAESEVSISTASQASAIDAPLADDTKLFLNEVIDSLTRGFDDRLQCDHLILEINSSRYAYNVMLREVNYNVVKAVLYLPFQVQKTTNIYLAALISLLKYFQPIFGNYIKNDAAMEDCLQAIQDVCDTCSELGECVAKVLHWLYEKDVLSEEAILKWHSKLDQDSRLRARTQPFVDWLNEADEESDNDSQ